MRTIASSLCVLYTIHILQPKVTATTYPWEDQTQFDVSPWYKLEADHHHSVPDQNNPMIESTRLLQVAGAGLSNIALASNGGVATQSSLYEVAVASLAIDGNTDGVYGQSLTHTQSEVDPWWEVALENVNSISHIDVYNRDMSNEEVVYSSADSAPNISSTARTLYSFSIPDIIGDKVKIMIPGENKVLSLAEVQVMGMLAGLSNAALTINGGVATQSSLYEVAVASLAIDGNTDGVYGQSVTHTQEEVNPWWEVALENLNSISHIDVYNRHQPNMRLRIVGFVLTIYWGELMVYNSADSAPNTSSTVKILYSFSIPDIIGDKVKIMIPGENKVLHMAEVKVMGIPISNPSQNPSLSQSPSQIPSLSQLPSSFPSTSSPTELPLAFMKYTNYHTSYLENGKPESMKFYYEKANGRPMMFKVFAYNCVSPVHASVSVCESHNMASGSEYFAQLCFDGSKMSPELNRIGLCAVLEMVDGLETLDESRVFRVFWKNK